MRIIGIDPGYAIIGWSVIESDLSIVDYGTITTSSKEPFDTRLLSLYQQFGEIIERYSPQVAAMERLFFQRNTTTAMDVARAIGAIILTLKMSNIDIFEYTPTQVKQALTGYGKADKQQMQVMVQKLFSLNEIPRPDDAADALAIAACHSCSGRIPAC